MRTNRMNGIGYLLPEEVQMREAVACDIFPRSVEWLCRDLLRHREKNGEFGRIATGCAVKTTSPFRWQKKQNRQRKLKEFQSAPYGNLIRAVNIARGAIGPVLCAAPLFSERRGLILGSYKEHFGIFA